MLNLSSLPLWSPWLLALALALTVLVASRLRDRRAVPPGSALARRAPVTTPPPSRATTPPARPHRAPVTVAIPRAIWDALDLATRASLTPPGVTWTAGEGYAASSPLLPGAERHAHLTTALLVADVRGWVELPTWGGVR